LNLHLSELAVTTKAKRKPYARLVREGRERIVFKRLDAAYVAGRPNRGGDQLKSKFVATATFIVAKVNTKRSVALELLGDDGNAVAVGNVTIPSNHGIPVVGQTVEVTGEGRQCSDLLLFRLQVT
jgi:bifunctional non-homologous end joining protein LigD